jgi:hypothetical protein
MELLLDFGVIRMMIIAISGNGLKARPSDIGKASFRASII